MSNQLNTKQPTETGYFLHHTVRHDTVDNTTYTKSFLPRNIKPFQQEQISLWAGSPQQKKTVSVMVISTRNEDATEMTKIFEQNFNNPSKMTFITKNYFSSLSPILRLQFIESQIAYTRTNRSILLRNIKNLNVPSIHVTSENEPILLIDCLKNINDYQGQPLFTNILPPVNNVVEAHILHKNLQLALEWERNSIEHIARKLNTHHYSDVFDLPQHQLDNIQPSQTEWIVPTPPDIQFLVPQRKAWAKIPTIIQNNNKITNQSPTTNDLDSTNTSVISTYSRKKKQNNIDNQTVETATTYQSESNDTISDLQDESRNHSRYLNEHNDRINTLSQQVENLQNLQAWTQRILHLENQQKQQHNTNELINHELNELTNTTLPTIMNTLTGHQQLLDTTISTQVTQHYELNKKLKKQDKEIQKLYMILNTLHNFQTTDQQMTPADSRRRKKYKQVLPDATFNINTPTTDTTNVLHSPPNSNIEIQIPANITKNQHTDINTYNSDDQTTTKMEESKQPDTQMIGDQTSPSQQNETNTSPNISIQDDQFSINTTTMTEDHITPQRTTTLHDTNHEYNSEDMISLPQLSPIQQLQPTQHTYDITDNSQNNTSSTEPISLVNNDPQRIQPRNLINIYPDREYRYTENNDKTQGNLETQETGHCT
jgi:hypothetical protein